MYTLGWQEPDPPVPPDFANAEERTREEDFFLEVHVFTQNWKHSKYQAFTIEGPEFNLPGGYSQSDSSCAYPFAFIGRFGGSSESAGPVKCSLHLYTFWMDKSRSCQTFQFLQDTTHEKVFYFTFYFVHLIHAFRQTLLRIDRRGASTCTGDQDQGHRGPARFAYAFAFIGKIGGDSGSEGHPFCNSDMPLYRIGSILRYSKYQASAVGGWVSI